MPYMTKILKPLSYMNCMEKFNIVVVTVAGDFKLFASAFHGLCRMQVCHL